MAKDRHQLPELCASPQVKKIVSDLAKKCLSAEHKTPIQHWAMEATSEQKFKTLLYMRKQESNYITD